MTKEGLKRKLTAILSADVEGYSRLMADDEVSTIHTLTVYKEAMASFIELHRGRVVDAPGDNLLAEFASVVDAVLCAVEVQRELAKRNKQLPKERKMVFRIGVNLGDVVEEKDRIYGDGVNIAARLESICQAGGVCISSTAFEHVENKLELEFKDLGYHEVKNITKPMRVYQVLLDSKAAVDRVVQAKVVVGKKWHKIALAIAALLVFGGAIVAIWNYYFRFPFVEAASVERMAFPLPDRPSIAVLPFDNLSGNAEQDYIADGISENIITVLSKIPEMFVIAKNSSFAYKSKPLKTRQVSEELGVKNILQGSVQKSGGRIRVTAQLIDAVAGEYLWAERFDRELTELFSIQDEITLKIVVSLQVKLTGGKEAEIRSGTKNIEAWELLRKGWAIHQQFTPEAYAEARNLYRRALEIDPNYANAWATLAWTYYLEYTWVSKDPESIKLSVEYMQKALEIDTTEPWAISLSGYIYFDQGQYEKAIEQCRKNVALNPSSSENLYNLAHLLRRAGMPNEALPIIKKAMRFSPFHPLYYDSLLGDLYRYLQSYDEAIEVGEQLLEQAKKENDKTHLRQAHLLLAASYAGLGNLKKAQVHIEERMRMNPPASLESIRQYAIWFWKDKAYVERLINLFQRAGLPEHPPKKTVE